MSKRDKLVKRILSGERNLKWQEVEALLKWLMYKPVKGETGSHITYENALLKDMLKKGTQLKYEESEFLKINMDLIEIVIVKPHKGKSFSKITINILQSIGERLYDYFKKLNVGEDNE